MSSPIRLVPRNEAEQISLYSVMYGDTFTQAQGQGIASNTLDQTTPFQGSPTAPQVGRRSRSGRHISSYRPAQRASRGKRGSTKTKKGDKVEPVTSCQSELKWRGLLSELIDHILSYCSIKDLLSLCTVSKALYLHSLPHLYRSIQDFTWSDAIVLKRRLESGIGPSSTNPKEVASLVARSMRDIEVKSYDQFDKLRVHAFTVEETAESLATITKLATNLKSISWQTYWLHGNLDPLLKALQRSSVQTLHLEEFIQLPVRPFYGKESPLWRLNTLVNLELIIPSIAKAPETPVVVGLANLIKNSTSLKHLTVILIGMPVVDENLANDFRVKNVKGDELFKVKEVSRLETINLEGIITKDAKLMKSFLTRLKEVEKLRLVQGSERDNTAYDRTIDEALDKIKVDTTSILPNLVELETCMPLLKAILPVASPRILKNVPVILPSVERHSIMPPPVTTQLSHIRACKSLEEMELVLYKYRGKVNRKKVIAAVQCVPTTIKRLAVIMPWEAERIIFENVDSSLCFLRHFERLVNLEMINLNWSSFLYHDPKLMVTGSQSTKPEEYQNRAIQIAKKLSENCPKLEYVMFQGSRIRNINNRVAWKVDWDVEADKGRRWTLKINRRSKCDQQSQVEDAIEGKTLNGGTKETTKMDDRDETKVEVLSATCTCPTCWKREAVKAEDACRAHRRNNTNDFMDGMDMDTFQFDMELIAPLAHMMLENQQQQLNQNETQNGPHAELWQDID